MKYPYTCVVLTCTLGVYTYFSFCISNDSRHGRSVAPRPLLSKHLVHHGHFPPVSTRHVFIVFELWQKLIKVDPVYHCDKDGYGRKVVFGQQSRQASCPDPKHGLTWATLSGWGMTRSSTSGMPPWSSLRSSLWRYTGYSTKATVSVETPSVVYHEEIKREEYVYISTCLRYHVKVLS